MISIVVPAYNEERNLEVLHRRVAEIMDGVVGRDDWELIFVDDGSADATWAAISVLNSNDARVRGVRLSRNFGHQSALMAGLAAARGQAVIMMDADLQHPPELLPDLVAKWREGYQIVHAVRRDPPNLSWFKRKTSRAYYKLFAFLSGVEIEPGAADFRLLDRQVLDEILQFEEEGLFLRGIVHWVGYATASVPFDCGERYAGSSKYNLTKMLQLGWHGVSAFSLVPLRIGIVIGLISSTIAFLGVCYAILGKWLDKEAIPGWASSVAISSFLFGVLFVFLAVLAEYVGRIAVEVRRRPRFLVRETTRTAVAASDKRARRGAVVDFRAEP
ncbi:MAG TPA: glycosyltransferase family 2 protein [Gammaproteobacteria bacterium]|nr:glycosyltransferase family 2 protein [Gammaproteobacteria bacterium]